MKNIDTAFRQVRSFALFMVTLCVLLTGLAIYQSFSMVRSIQGKVYILSSGKALEALASDRKDNIAVELRDHINTFHQYFFNLSPDDKAIASTITKALYLADHSAKRVYDDLKEKGYYTSLISANASQQLTIDSTVVDISVTPYYYRLYGHELITRTTTETIRSLVTEGYIRNVARSDNNPHGFLIERWRVLENKDIQTKSR